jgi:hypothetical protein
VNEIRVTHEGRSHDDVAKHVLRYFLRNPHASDDVEGIAHWRLLDQVVRDAVEDTTRAVELLLARGFLTRVAIAGSRHLFSLNPEKRDAAERFLQGEASRRQERP